ncbi:hypothetical protein [Microcella alkalica]|uniref:Transcriptional regulator, AbiEi antitoxin, Type IV TA system n=1 Tax=Microcella alkalica TaxID=355930 RepID=A0A839E9D7_9MICO|nr:hypothetical protein [Microcella alkalica]MBA8848107.1 hypothetical protein [Microcella alkalica]
MTTAFTPAVREAFAAAIVVAEHPDDIALSRRLHRGRSRGELVALTRGVFVPSASLAALARWEVEVLRAWAASALGRVRQPLCRASAARLWGAPVLDGGAAPSIHALGWGIDDTRHRGDVRYWATRDPAANLVTLEGARLTDLPRTLAELSASATFAGAVAAIDWGVRVRRRKEGPVTTVDEIRAVADALAFVRGRGRLECALAFADGRSESPGESWARVLMHELGFEAPELQHEYRLPDGRVFRTDFRWPSIGLAGEFDGLAKYRAADVRAGRSVEQVVVEEKEREDGVRSTGDGMLRLVWGDLRDRRRFAHRLEGAGVPRRRGRRTPY